MEDRAQGGATRISLPATSSPSTAPSSGSRRATFLPPSSPSLPSLPSPPGAPASPSCSTTASVPPIAEETDYVAGVLERALGEVR